MSALAQREPLASIAPTGLSTLLECPLHFAFGRDKSSGSGPPSAAAMIGDVCHAVLERQVEKQPPPADLNAFVASAWDEEAAGLERKHGLELGTFSRSRLVRSRLVRTARALAALLAEAGEAEHICEQEMAAKGGRLVGRPDLVIHGEQAHWIVDYKSGSAIDAAGAPNEHYTSQVQLYAVLEHERSGSWPSRAIVLPLRGPKVELEIEPAVCEALAARALEALEAYNNTLGGCVEARPSLEHCRWCDWACGCEAFWAAAAPEWAVEGLRAVLGEVSERVDTTGAGTSIQLLPSKGTLEGREAIWVRGISPERHPALEGVSPGKQVALARLRVDREDGVFTLPDSGLLSLT